MAGRTFLAVGAALTATLTLGWYASRFSSTENSNTLPPPGSTESADVVLDQEQRGYIWQIEHHVLVLNKYWLHDLSAALSRADAGSLEEMLAPDFQGALPRQPSAEELKTVFARVTRRKDAGNPPVPLGRDSFVKYLLDLRRMFIGVPHVKVFAKTLVPDVRADLESAWSGSGVMRMWGEVGRGKPGEVVAHFEFSLPRPAEDHQRHWLHRARVIQSQVSQAESFLLRDVTRQRGIDPDLFHDNWKQELKVSGLGGIFLCDYNRDGRLDLLVVDIKRIYLFQGQADGKFKDVTAEVGLPIPVPPGRYTQVAAFADLDGDGWEDLILFGRIYRNDQGHSFQDYTYRSNLHLSAHAGGIVVADFDRDGKVDLYVTQAGVGKEESWLNGKSGRESGNELWRNLGGWQFEDVTLKSGTAGGYRSVFSAVWLDANDDGWPDLYVPNEFGHGVLLVNRGDGTFREQVIGKLPGDFGTMGITCGDVNNDGKIDLYLANMYSKTGIRIVGNVKPESYPPNIMAKLRQFVAGSQLYLNRGDLKFEPVSKAWQMNDVGWAYGPALLDLDNDGFLDVFATSGFMSVDRSEPDG